MRLHLTGLPHTETTSDFLTCAYTQKIVKFGRMMTDAGYDVVLYSGEDNETPCAEHVQVFTRAERERWFGVHDSGSLWGHLTWDPASEPWTLVNARTAAAIRERAEPEDLVLLIAGLAQRPLAVALADLTSCEWGVGYEGIFSPFCAFESYAWRHVLYSKMAAPGTTTVGRWYDAVIPNYFDPDDFGPARPPDRPPYFLFIGRGIRRKGPQIAADVAEYLGVQLVIAGAEIEPGGFPAYGERAGIVGPAIRREMMAGAVAVFAPTLYGGPFEGVAVEAMMSGAPVITSDWGAFAETVQDGDGWRCHTMAEYVDAGRAALNGIRHDRAGVRRARRERAINRYGLNAVGAQYERFFGRLFELQGPGWGHMEHWRPPEA